ncbi:MAG TPA: hypothetical protein DEB09_03290 [Candidatus Magasanikbacteria bacterium]|nr:hypothetical protein [Candidatus Magasanikbacteria bacterium]
MDYQQSNKSLNNTQKTGFVLLLVFGILAVGLGLLQMRNAIYNPFVVRLSDTTEQAQVLLDDEVRLQSIDTDNDGLNDWEEINFYETSPYLPDTDSDGTDDKIEIDRGTNPSCAENREVCEKKELPSEIKSEDVIIDEETATSTPVEVGLDSQSGTTTGSEVIDAEKFSSMMSNPQQLRDFLVSTGQISKEDLDKVGDDVLLNLLNEIMTKDSSGSTSE